MKTACQDVEIVQATEKELYSVTVMTKKYFPYTGFNFEEILKRMGSGNTKYLVAKQGSRTVGYVDYELLEDQAKILGLAVLEECRGRGTGKKLLEKALEQIAAAGKKTVFIFVAEDNKIAQDLYLAAGFQNFGTLERKLNDKTVLLMKKELF